MCIRDRGWDEEFGTQIESRQLGFEQLEAYTLEHGEPRLESGRQELLENILNDYI